jgi:hypothetical protein
MFNECMKTRYIPLGTIDDKNLKKGKGNASTPDACSGIVLKSNAFKDHLKLFTNRLTKAAELHIPDQQFGFR